ncbi:MAG: D-alanyl-D-alanine carboxypeptidase family protein [Chloroflexota bacterium]
MIRRTRLALLSAILLVCLGVAACGGDDSPSNTTSPTAAGQHTTPATTPAPTASPVEVLYVVQDGDTLAGIAEAYGVTIDALTQANAISDPDSLKIGDVLTIPGITVAPVPATATPAPTDGETPVPTDTPPPSAEVTTLQLVDKEHSLPALYLPDDVTPVPAAYVAPGYTATLSAAILGPLEAMLDGANAAGYDIRVVSGFRSYADQQYTYNYWVQQLGETEANRISAMPGHSEHQLGTTADLGSGSLGWDLQDGFGASSEGQWLATHSAEYGFVISYPEGKEAITGYAYEPWHFRYLGVEAAAAYAASGLTLNQYLATPQ